MLHIVKVKDTSACSDKIIVVKALYDNVDW